MAIRQEIFGVNSRSLRVLPRFSLRTILLLSAVVCLSLGYEYSNAKRQERAVAAIEKAGGRVEYDWSTSTVRSVMKPQPRGPAWLRTLLGPHYFNSVVGVDISHTLVHGSPSDFESFKAALRQLPTLKRLHVFALELSDDNFTVIGQLQSLEALSLARIELTEGGAQQIAHIKNLRKLSLGDAVVPAAALVQIKDLPLLQALTVYCRHEDRAPNGAPIWNLEKYALRDDALTSLPTLTALRDLSLTFTQITDDGIAIIGRMINLRNVDISSPKITNASMEHWKKLPNLSSLDITACAMDADGVARLIELPHLTKLGISGPAIGNDCLPIIARLQNLEWLDLGGRTIDESGLHHLEGMCNLKYLDLQSTAVKTNSPTVLRLKKALPALQIHQYFPSLSFR